MYNQFIKKKIFVSSTTAGLWKYREMVSTVLQAQGFKAVVQEDSEFTPSTMHRFLHQKLQSVQGMIALVGPFYGLRMPVQLDRPYSYTQYELTYALRNRIPTRIFFTGPNFEPSPLRDGSIPSEPTGHAKEQEDFREWIHRTYLIDAKTAGWNDFNNESEFTMSLAKIDWKQLTCRNKRN